MKNYLREFGLLFRVLLLVLEQLINQLKEICKMILKGNTPFKKKNYYNQNIKVETVPLRRVNLIMVEKHL